MVVTGAVLHGDTARFLDFNETEHPVALQLGGSDPAELAKCSGIAEEWGYDEVNLNCGCPSDRVQKGKIGAVLMKEPQLVADCVSAMRELSSIPVTVKHRIGIDDQEDYDDMAKFVETIANTGCQTFIVHARKAWLKGLSPKENREIPPLDYAAVARLKRDFPGLTIVVNGGITTIQQSKNLLKEVDGVMVGREAYSNPYFLAEVDRQLFDDERVPPSRKEVLEEYVDYCEYQLAKGARLHHMARHILGLYNSQKGGRLFRRHISDHAYKPDAKSEVLIEAQKATYL